MIMKPWRPFMQHLKIAIASLACAVFFFPGFASSQERSRTLGPTYGKVQTQEEMEAENPDWEYVRVRREMQEAKERTDRLWEEQLQRFPPTDDHQYLLDKESGLLWTRFDNKSNISWGDAARWCAEKRMRLPTVQEFRAIYLPQMTGGAWKECGTRECYVSGAFELSSNWFWTSSEGQDRDKILIVDLSDFLAWPVEKGGVSTKDDVLDVLHNQTRAMRAVCVWPWDEFRTWYQGTCGGESCKED